MGLADRLSALYAAPAPPDPELAVQEVPDTPAPAPAVPFDPSWWDGLGVSFAGDGLWAPDAKATLHLNGQKAQYRRATAEGDPVAWIESKWAQWYPALDRAKSRTEFHALWMCIRWTVEEMQRIVTEAA